MSPQVTLKQILGGKKKKKEEKEIAIKKYNHLII